MVVNEKINGIGRVIKKGNPRIIQIGALGSFFLVVFFMQQVTFSHSSIAHAVVAEDMSSEQVASFVKPAVVAVIHQTEGTAIVPQFKVDFNKFTFTVNPKLKVRNVPIDQLMGGTGFVVNPDGYIITNAHVVSSEMIRAKLVQLTVEGAISDALKGMTSSQKAAVYKIIDARSEEANATPNEAKSVALYNSISDNIDLKVKETITVLDPSTARGSLEDTLKKGFVARILDEGKDFIRNNRDVALIKIDQQKLPSVLLAENALPAIGQKVGAVGFPGAGQLDEKDFLKPALSNGVVSALKEEENSDFKYIETDTKIGSGSSGSPLFDKYGGVIGIATAVGDNSGTAGDTFAFAIPISVVRSVLEKNNVAIGLDNYSKYYRDGLTYLIAGDYVQARDTFTLAKQVNNRFVSDTSDIDEYIAQSTTAITAAEAIVKEKEAQQKIAEDLARSQRLKSILTWTGVGGVILLLIVVIAVLIVRSRRDRVQLERLEDVVESNVLKDFAAGIQKQPVDGTYPQLPPQAPVPPPQDHIDTPIH